MHLNIKNKKTKKIVIIPPYMVYSPENLPIKSEFSTGFPNIFGNNKVKMFSIGKEAENK